MTHGHVHADAGHDHMPAPHAHHGHGAPTHRETAVAHSGAQPATIPPRFTQEPGWSLLRWSAVARIGLVSGLLALLWLAVAAVIA